MMTDYLVGMCVLRIGFEDLSGAVGGRKAGGVQLEQGELRPFMVQGNGGDGARGSFQRYKAKRHVSMGLEANGTSVQVTTVIHS